jgi:hypothetical protein
MAYERLHEELVDSQSMRDRPTLVSSLWRFSTLLFVGLGYLVFELTSDVVLGIFVTCLKFGGDDILTALWARSDPIPARGSVVSLFCLAKAFFQIAGAGLTLVAVLGVAESVLHLPVNLDKGIAGMSLLFCGLFLGMASTTIGAILAVDEKIRVWIDEYLSNSRRLHQFPPLVFGDRNRAKLLLLISGAFAILLGSGGAVTGVLQAIEKRDGDMLAAVPVVVVMFGWPLWRLMRAWRMIAKSPDECWGQHGQRTTAE